MQTSLVSIVMPTFNSARTIEKSLQSISEQDYPRSSVEILLLDGGSTDETLKIGERYGAIAIPNPKTQQEYGKFIGLNEANGEFIIFLDSDEVFCNQNAIAKRVNLFKSNSKIGMVLTGGYQHTPGTSPINDYINMFSDPFAFYMNRISSDAHIFTQDMIKKFNADAECNGGYVLNFKKNKSLPLIDLCAGNTISKKIFTPEYGLDKANLSLIPTMFYAIVEKGISVAVLNNDAILHYSADTIKNYLRKLKWRVTVNIHYQHIPGTGFSNRESFQPAITKFKKYLFPLYSISLIAPIFDSLFQFRRKGYWINFIHTPLCLYVTYNIGLQYIFKIFGHKPKIFSYGANTKELNLD